MRCFFHQNIEAVAICKQCGKGMCMECSAVGGHKGLCPECLKEGAFEERKQNTQKVGDFAVELKQNSKAIGSVVTNFTILSILWIGFVIVGLVAPKFLPQSWGFVLYIGYVVSAVAAILEIVQLVKFFKKLKPLIKIKKELNTKVELLNKRNQDINVQYATELEQSSDIVALPKPTKIKKSKKINSIDKAEAQVPIVEKDLQTDDLSNKLDNQPQIQEDDVNQPNDSTVDTEIK